MMSKRLKKKGLILCVILGLIVAMTISIPAIWAQSKQTSVQKWVWTKKNPKPSWWKWDETYYPTQPVRGGYYRTASLRDVGLMNPNHWPVNNFPLLDGIYERLIHIDGSYRPIIPWLAKSWKYTSPLAVTMKLRKGIKFHDGTQIGRAHV